jgi:hypothetical protein
MLPQTTPNRAYFKPLYRGKNLYFVLVMNLHRIRSHMFYSLYRKKLFISDINLHAIAVFNVQVYQSDVAREKFGSSTCIIELLTRFHKGTILYIKAIRFLQTTYRVMSSSYRGRSSVSVINVIIYFLM